MPSAQAQTCTGYAPSKATAPQQASRQSAQPQPRKAFKKPAFVPPKRKQHSTPPQPPIARRNDSLASGPSSPSTQAPNVTARRDGVASELTRSVDRNASREPSYRLPSAETDQMRCPSGCSPSKRRKTAHDVQPLYSRTAPKSQAPQTIQPPENLRATRASCASLLRTGVALCHAFVNAALIVSSYHLVL